MDFTQLKQQVLDLYHKDMQNKLKQDGWTTQKPDGDTEIMDLQLEGEKVILTTEQVDEIMRRGGKVRLRVDVFTAANEPDQ